MKDFIPVPPSLRPALRNMPLKELGMLFVSLIDYMESGEQRRELNNRVKFAFDTLKAEIDAIRENPDHSSFSTEGMNIRPAYFPYPSCEAQSNPPKSPPLSIYNISSLNSISSENEDKQEKGDKKKEKGVQGGKKPSFTPPTLEEVREYLKKRNSPVDAESFWHFYESKNWMVGKNKMTTWHSAVVTWEKRERSLHGTDNRNAPENAQRRMHEPLPGETVF